MGKCTYPDGKIYEGEWKEGKPHGGGIKFWPDGRKYDGEWCVGKPFGIGKKVYPDGKFKQGYWEGTKFYEGCKLKHLIYVLIFSRTTKRKSILATD